PVLLVLLPGALVRSPEGVRVALLQGRAPAPAVRAPVRIAVYQQPDALAVLGNQNAELGGASRAGVGLDRFGALHLLVPADLAAEAPAVDQVAAPVAAARAGVRVEAEAEAGMEGERGFGYNGGGHLVFSGWSGSGRPILRGSSRPLFSCLFYLYRR